MQPTTINNRQYLKYVQNEECCYPTLNIRSTFAVYTFEFRIFLNLFHNNCCQNRYNRYDYRNDAEYRLNAYLSFGMQVGNGSLIRPDYWDGDVNLAESEWLYSRNSDLESRGMQTRNTQAKHLSLKWCSPVGPKIFINEVASMLLSKRQSFECVFQMSIAFMAPYFGAFVEINFLDSHKQVRGKTEVHQFRRYWEHRDLVFRKLWNNILRLKLLEPAPAGSVPVRCSDPRTSANITFA